MLEAQGLSLGHFYKDVSLQVHAGEMLGVYGYMGCGQIELARTLFGKLRPEAGSRARGLVRSASRNTAQARRGGHRLRAGEPAQHALRR